VRRNKPILTQLQKRQKKHLGEKDKEKNQENSQKAKTWKELGSKFWLGNRSKHNATRCGEGEGCIGRNDARGSGNKRTDTKRRFEHGKHC